MKVMRASQFAIDSPVYLRLGFAPHARHSRTLMLTLPCFCRSGDGYWELPEGLKFSLDASKPVDVRVTCSDGSPPKTELGLLPEDMLCAYQDPLCARKVGTIQC